MRLIYVIKLLFTSEGMRLHRAKAAIKNSMSSRYGVDAELSTLETFKPLQQEKKEIYDF